MPPSHWRTIGRRRAGVLLACYLAALAWTEVGAAAVQGPGLMYAKGPYLVQPVAQEDAMDAQEDFEYAGMTDEDQTHGIEAEMMGGNYSSQVANMKEEETDIEKTLDASVEKTAAINTKEGALRKYVMDEVDSFAEAIRTMNKKMTEGIDDAEESPGPPGLPGIKGSDGDAGVQGPTGPNGTDGVSLSLLLALSRLSLSRSLLPCLSLARFVFLCSVSFTRCLSLSHTLALFFVVLCFFLSPFRLPLSPCPLFSSLSRFRSNSLLLPLERSCPLSRFFNSLCLLILSVYFTHSHAFLVLRVFGCLTCSHALSYSTALSLVLFLLLLPPSFC